MVTSATTFESILWYKYNIREKLSALGTFVAYPNYSRDASDLVMLGLSSRCLVVAKVNLGGDSVDYELVSMSPIHLLSLNIHSYSKRKIVVESPYKVQSWVYQLCSCEDQDTIWQEFVNEIRKSHGQTYYCPTLESLYIDNKGYNVATLIPSGSVKLDAPSIMRDMNNNSLPIHHISAVDFVVGDNSPEEETGLGTDSLFEDVEFDSFVNNNDIPKLGDKDLSNQTTNNNKDTICCDKSVFYRFKKKLKKLFT